MNDDQDSMRDRRIQRARLAHDVAKYIARIARNVRGEVPPPLVPLLLRDWYGTDVEPSPAETFERASDLLSQADATFCAAAFAKLLKLRARAEAGEQEALSEGVALALAIADRIEEGVREG